MDFDFGNIIYIIFAILYFVFTATKKKKPERQPTTSDSPSRKGDTLGPPPVKHQPTFEELLEEFTGKKKQAQEVLRKEEPILEQVKIKEHKPVTAITREREKPKARPSQQNERFEEFEEKEKETTDYQEMLSDLDGAKKAFVLSEIFNRKY